jgi:hypothetical protein
MFKITSTGSSAQARRIWLWRPIGNKKIEISWGTGLSTYHGKLKKISEYEFEGTLKYSCDTWFCGNAPKGRFRIQKTSCDQKS